MCTQKFDFTKTTAFVQSNEGYVKACDRCGTGLDVDFIKMVVFCPGCGHVYEALTTEI